MVKAWRSTSRSHVNSNSWVWMNESLFVIIWVMAMIRIYSQPTGLMLPARFSDSHFHNIQSMNCTWNVDLETVTVPELDMGAPGCEWQTDVEWCGSDRIGREWAESRETEEKKIDYKILARAPITNTKNSNKEVKDQTIRQSALLFGPSSGGGDITQC